MALAHNTKVILLYILTVLPPTYRMPRWFNKKLDKADWGGGSEAAEKFYNLNQQVKNKLANSVFPGDAANGFFFNVAPLFFILICHVTLPFSGCVTLVVFKEKSERI